VSKINSPEVVPLCDSPVDDDEVTGAFVPEPLMEVVFPLPTGNGADVEITTDDWDVKVFGSPEPEPIEEVEFPPFTGNGGDEVESRVDELELLVREEDMGEMDRLVPFAVAVTEPEAPVPVICHPIPLDA
jgi:hypothetical protein